MSPMKFAGVIFAFCVAVTARGESDNLVKSGGFEEAMKGDAPAGWWLYAPHGEAKSELVKPGAQSGQCVRIETSKDVKACLVSDPIPVAPGEKLSLSVMCRVEDLSTASGGSLAFSAGFQDASHHYFRWHRARPAPPKSGEWVPLRTEAEVPEGAAYVTFQMGVDAMTGRTYWDGAELRAPGSLAVRFAKSGTRLVPGEQRVPLVLINRDAKLADKKVVLSARPGQLDKPLKLRAEPETPITANFDVQKRGKVTLSATLKEGEGGATLASAELVGVVPPLLTAEPLVPTHWCVEDGPPQIEGRVWVCEEHAKRAGLSLVCTLGEAERPLATTRVPVGGVEAVEFKLEPKECGLGDYVVHLRLEQNGKVLAQAEQDWHVIHRAQTEVTLGADGYLRVEGKPFFPIGIYNCGRFEEMAAAGFNVSHGYNVVATPRGEIPNQQKVKDWLDGNHKAGMRMLMLVTHGMGPGSRSAGPEVVRRVRMFRNHPGLLAWDEEEGVARGEMPPSFLPELCAMLRKEGPGHPIMIGDTREAVTKLDRSNLFPQEVMDLGMWWWYPFPLTRKTQPVTATQMLAGENAGAGLELLPPEFLVHPNTSKPIWVGIQAYKKPRSDGRYPTPQEYRAQAYLGVIAGARGLMYYGGSVTGGILLDPKAGHWEELKQLVRELRGMASTFMSPDAPEEVQVTPAGAAISLRLKAVGGGRVLLAVNRSDQPVRATFETAALKASSVKVLHENREVAAESGDFADAFKPYEVHVYQW